MRQTTTAALRLRTIAYWASFAHARGDVDVARVHAFQAIVRETPDLATVTDDEVSAAYGGRGWAPTPVCYECGARDDSNVLFGPEKDVSLCAECILKADGFNVVPAPKKSLFERLIGA
jgi:hypothetical protein